MKKLDIFSPDNTAAIIELNQLDGPFEEPLPSLDEAMSLLRAGYQLDTKGRPLHPWIMQMIAHGDDSAKGGKGDFWHWGPNYTADPIVISGDAERSVLLIRRSDSGEWALPGGFIEPDESPLSAARRELHEEAGLALDGSGVLVYEGPVADRRATAHAWPETSAYLFTLPEALPVQAGDDATDAQWFGAYRLPDALYGSHRALIDRALRLKR